MKGYTTFKKPYILLEDSRGKCQPVYKEYTKEIPCISLESPVLCCPFSSARRHPKPKKMNLTKSGYCEICYTKFEDYVSHVECEEHREYGKDDYNYRMIDVFIKELLEQELFGESNYLHSPCERLEERYSSCQPIVYNSSSDIYSSIRFSKGSIDDSEDIVEFEIRLNNINRKFSQ